MCLPSRSCFFDLFPVGILALLLPISSSLRCLSLIIIRAYGKENILANYLSCRVKPDVCPSGIHILKMYTFPFRGSTMFLPVFLFTMQPSFSSNATMLPAAVKSAVEIRGRSTSATWIFSPHLWPSSETKRTCCSPSFKIVCLEADL